MKIRDIVNRDIVNLTNCDQEPIHIPGSIQPHGFLLAVNNEFFIEFCSGNVGAFLGIEHNRLLQKNISELVDEKQLSGLKEYIHSLTGNITEPLVLWLFEKNYHCNIHGSGGLWILEFEPIQTQPAIATIYNQTVQFVQYMQDAASLQQLCDNVAGEIRTLTGYDRVMVYRFDKDYNGEVYAESKREDLEPFLGLHYPHTDIPAQARELYIRNLLRIIVDVSYEPVPIYTIDDKPGKNVDLSLSVLRSTSPIHVQYLFNMGVGATLTISLIHEGKLWGLIACHHYSAKYIDHYTRMSARLQGHFLTSQINIRQAAEEYAIARQVNASLEELLNESFHPDRASLSAIIKHPSLLSLCNASGVAIILDDTIYKNGLTGSDEDILQIAAWAGPHSRQRFFQSSKLVNEFPAAVSMCTTASGIIYYTLRSMQDACIIWFNPETLEEVSWAGDPEKAIEKNQNGLSPRKSFEAWKTVIKCQAREWKAPELSAAANYAYALQKHVTFILLNEEEQRQRSLTQQLKDTNAELENINWISTHDLKEPLRKIQILSSRLLVKEKDLSKDMSQTLNKMSEAANRMQQLIEALVLYAKTRQVNDNYEEIDLQEKVRDIVKGFSEESADKKATININHLPTIKAVPLLIQQLFVNLIQNALKFAQKDVAPVIDILGYGAPVTYPEGGNTLYHKVTIKDNGIGFDPSDNEAIFKVFTRLNSIKDYDGSGMGLALCRKIMQLQHGFIRASGKENEGAVFELYFTVG